MSDVIQQQDWDDTKLKASGFKQFERKKEVIMARTLPDAEAPKEIHTRWGESLLAKAGYMICYAPSDKVHDKLDDYDHWPVEPTIFTKTYKSWDEPFEPTPAQQHLMDNGCQPFYKAIGIWAKELEGDVYIQGLEHKRPILVPKERVLAIGAEGEPYHMGEQTFHDRYDGTLSRRPKGVRGLVNRLINFFKQG